MAKVDIKNIQGKKVGDLDLDDAVFGAEINEHLLWEVVKWQLAGRRAGTHATKGRAEVRGSSSKPWKQKGTGRARAGHKRSPVWVGGGQTFGPRPRDYSYSINKKVRKNALRGALSLRARESRIVVLDGFDVDGKTKSVVSALRSLGSAQPERSVLIVADKGNDNLIRGTRNLTASKWLAPEGLNVYDVLNHETLILTQGALGAVQEALR